MKPRLNRPDEVMWHHANGTALSPCAGTQHHNVDIIDNSHQSRWPGFTSQVYKNSRGEHYHVGYHLVIDFDNETITRTRAFSEEGAHCIGKNLSSVGVLMIGNYDECSGEEIPSEKEYLIVQAWEMIKEELPHLTIPKNNPHRKYASKSCFGDSLADNYVQNVILAGETTQPVEDKQEEIMHIETLRS